MIKTWLHFDEQTRAAVEAIMNDEQALKDAFGAELAFGTGGLRGVIGVGTNKMNIYTVAKATQGLANYLKLQGGKAVAIGYDTRHYSDVFAYVAAGVLTYNGLAAYVYDRQMPTPMLSYAVREMHCDAGIVITASHNPSKYNGYKVYGSDGCQITDEAAAAITEQIDKVAYDTLKWQEKDEAIASGKLIKMPKHIYDTFIEKTLAVLDEEQGTIKIVYTPLNGAGYEPVMDVFKRMEGVKVSVVDEQIAPDGDFPTCQSPNPELKEALALGLKKAQAEGADILIATDPDCDRVGVAVKSGNTYVRLSGNEVGIILLEYILSHKQYPKAPTVIKTIVTSDLALPIAAHYGANLKQVLTGFKYIGEVIGRMEAKGEAELFAFGFEESCGYLAAPHVRDKDGVMAAALIANVAKAYKQQGITLYDAICKIYDTYGYLENRLLNFDLKGIDWREQMQEIMQRMRQTPPQTLVGESITAVKDYLQGIDELPVSDVLSYQTQTLKAIVRPSGTEPKVKVYLFAKDTTKEKALAKIEAMDTYFHTLF